MATHASQVKDGPPSLRAWIRDHDDKWLFVVIYLGLAVGLSVFVSLFWLLVVAGLHFVFEIVRQAYYKEGAREVILHALWEIKLDVGLVLLALTLVLYIDVVLGLLGLQSAARAAAVTRAGARIGSRAAAWERNIRTFLLTVDEMVRVLYAGIVLRKKRAQSKRANGRPEAGAEEEGEPEQEARVAVAAGTGQGEEEDGEASIPAALVVAREERAARGEAAHAGASASSADGPPGDDDPGAYVPEGDAPAGDDAGDGAPPEAPEDVDIQGAGGSEAPPAPPAPGPDGERWTARPAWRRKWGIADRIGVALVSASVLLILAAPLLTSHGWGSAAAALLAELRPFPS